MNTDEKCWGGPQVEGIAQDRIRLLCRYLSLSVFISVHPWLHSPFLRASVPLWLF
jgi:hypothetical protein